MQKTCCVEARAEGPACDLSAETSMQQRTGCDTCGPPETDDIDTAFGYMAMALGTLQMMEQLPAEDALSCTKSTDRPMLRSSS